VHDALDAAGHPHAFGGAIALAYCTGEPRATRDLDVNVFANPARAREVLGALPPEVDVEGKDIQAAEADGQVRVWWGDTPIDVVLDLNEFHAELAERRMIVPFEDHEIPVLDCTDLAVLKALFDRTKDWADIEEMVSARTLDIPRVQAWLGRLCGENAAAIHRLQQLAR